MIEINNLTKFNLDEKEIKEKIEKLLGKKIKESDLSIALVEPIIIKNLNKKYRGKNKATDVLSFDGFKNKEKKFRIEKAAKKEDMGEIIICPEEIGKNAKKFKSDFETEFNKVLIHGILHLLGYDHEKSKKKAKLMEKKQHYYLKIINK